MHVNRSPHQASHADVLSVTPRGSDGIHNSLPSEFKAGKQWTRLQEPGLSTHGLASHTSWADHDGEMIERVTLCTC